MSPKKAKSLTQLLATFDVETLGEGDRNAGLICWHSLPGVPILTTLGGSPQSR